MPEVLIFDLDGTILSVNSFPVFAGFMLRGHAVARPGVLRWCVMAAVFLLLAARGLRLIGHDFLRWHLLALWRRSVRNDGRRAERKLLAILLPLVRPQLRETLASVRSGHCGAVLATAAAREYAAPLAQALGFRHVVATIDGPRPGPGNAGGRKRDAVIRLLAELGWQSRTRIFFTDHTDDMKLMAVCQRVHWFGSAAAAEKISAALPHLRLVCETVAPFAPA